MSKNSLYQRVVQRLYPLALKILNAILPKDPNKLVFASLPDFADNAKGFWEYIQANPGYQTVWLAKDKEVVAKLRGQNIQCYHADSWQGMKALLSAKYIVCTHSQYNHLKAKSQVFVNLWHGMPLKSMGYIDQLCSEQDLKEFSKVSKRSDVFIATSPLMKYVMSSCFNMDPRKVLVTGQPRNDKLFSEVPPEVVHTVLGEKAAGYKKYILYCPTFRVGMGRVEGKKFNGNVFNFPDYDREQLAGFLQAENALLVVKLHPFEERQYRDEELNLPEHAVVLRSPTLNQNLLGLYDILGLFDVLLTDYSSIYFDYLLLDRPILFVTSDLSEYTSGRGLVFGDYDFWAPGPKSSTFAACLENLQNAMHSADFYRRERKLVNDLVNDHQDNLSGQRVLNSLKKL